MQVQAPQWSKQLVDAEARVAQLAGLGRDGLVAVLDSGSTVALTSARGTLVWSADDQDSVLQLGDDVLVLDGSGGVLVLSQPPGCRIQTEDRFYDRVAGEGRTTSAASQTGVFALACGRRLIIVDEQREVQREISLPSGDVVGLCWAGGSLIGRRSGSSCTVVRWPDGCSEAAVLPDSDVDSTFTCLAASPDGGLVAAGCSDGQVLVWSLGTGTTASHPEDLVQRLSHNAAVEAVSWDAQSQLLAVSDGASVSIWEFSDSREAAQPVSCYGHQARARVTCLGFHSTLPLLASGSDHGQVVVYDTAVLQPGKPLEPQLRASVSLAADCTRTCVTALSWLRDGRLAAGCDDGRIVSWDIPGEAQPVDRATDATLQPQAAPAAQSAQAHSIPPPPETSQSVAALRALSASPANVQPSEPAADTTQARSGFTYAQVVQPQCVQSGVASPASSQAGAAGPPADEQLQRDGSGSVSGAVQRTLFPAERQTAAEEAASVLAAAAAEQNLMLKHSKPPLEVSSAADAEASSAGAQPQPPATPETQSKSGRSKRGSRRGKSHSQTSLNTNGSSNSTPEFQRHRSMSSLASAGRGVPRSPHHSSAPTTPAHLSPQNSAWSPLGAMPLHSAPYGVYFQPGPVQMGMVPGGMMLPHHHGGGQPPYVAAMPSHPGGMAYMPSAMGASPMPYLMPSGMHWAPYPSSYQEAYGMAQQGWCMPPGTPQAYGHATPPQSPSTGDFSQANGAATPAAKGLTPKRNGATKRGSRGRGGSSSGGRGSGRGSGANTSSEDSPAEQSSDCSSSLKTGTSEQENGQEVATPVTTIYVGNLPPEVHEHTLIAAFSCFGPITACEVVRERVHRESRGFAFITFAHASYAASAMVNMNGAMLYGPFRDMALRVAPSSRDLHAQAQQVGSLKGTKSPGLRSGGASNKSLPSATAASTGGGAALSAEQRNAADLSTSKQQHAAEQKRQLVQRARQVVAEAEQAGPSEAAGSLPQSPSRPPLQSPARAAEQQLAASAAAASAAASQALAGIAAVVAETPSDADSEEVAHVAAAGSAS